MADCSAYERDYPVLARMYLWAIRTKWFDFAYHLVVLYGISVGALGTLFVAAGAPVPMGWIFVAWFLVALGMLVVKYVANSLYWSWLYRVSHRHAAASAAGLHAYIQAHVAAHPGEPVDIAPYFARQHDAH